MSIGTAIAPGIAAAASASTFSPVLSTTSVGLVVRQNTGARRARSPGFERRPRERRAVGERRVRPLERGDLGRDLLVAALRRPALPVEPLLHARRGRSSRARARARRDRRPDRPRPRRRRTPAAPRGSRRSCAAIRAPSRPAPHPASCPGGSARCTSSKPGRTTFFDADIAASRSRRSSGTVAIPTAASYSLGAGRPGESAEEPVGAGTRETDEPEVLHRGAGYRSGSVAPL